MTVTITCDTAGVVTANENKPINVVLQMSRDGRSAYEIAVSNGYQGTEIEWIQQQAAPDVDGGLIY